MEYVLEMMLVPLILALCINFSRQSPDSLWTKRKEVEENSDIILEFPLNCLRPDDDRLEFFCIRVSSDKFRQPSGKFRVKVTTTLNNETSQVDIRLDINDTSRFNVGSKHYTCGVLNASHGQEVLVSANFTFQIDHQKTDECLLMTPRSTSPPAARRRGDPVCCVYSCLTDVKMWRQLSASGRKEFIYPGRNGVIDLGFSVNTSVSGILLFTILNVSGVGQSTAYGLERDGVRVGYSYIVYVKDRQPRSDYTSATTTANVSSATHLENNTQQNSTHLSTHWTVNDILIMTLVFPSVAAVVVAVIIYFSFIWWKRRVGCPNVAGINERFFWIPITNQPLMQ